MFCPVCRDEFESAIAVCPDDGVALIADLSTFTQRPTADALLGRFHPAVAERLVDLLRRRAIAFELFDLGEDADDRRAGGVEILVDRSHRDDLRSEIVVNWQEMVQGLEHDTMYEVLREGGNLPGWRDAPTSSWIDREGKLQVGFDDDDNEADARRTLGPMLVLVGVFLILLGWYADANWEPLAYVMGGTSLLSGLIVPR